VCTSKSKQGINSPLPTGRHLQESRAPSPIVVTWEDKCHHSKHPPFLLLPPTLYAEQDSVWCGLSLGSVGSAVVWTVPWVSQGQLWCGLSLGSVGSAVPAACPPSHAPQPARCQGLAREAEKASAWCKHCSCVISTVSSTNPKHSPALATMKKINSTPTKTSTLTK